MFGWFQRKPVPAFVAAYRAKTPGKLNRKAAIEDLTFIALDAETSGFDPAKDHLLSIGIIPIRAGRLEVSARRSWLVQQAATPNNEAVKIHGIAPGESAGGTPEVEVLTELLPLLSGAVIVGHHIGFDAAIIGAALRRHFGVRLRNRLIDTAMVAMRHVDAFHRTGYANQRPPGLDEICQHAGLPVVGRHTASGDAFTTGQLFLWLCSRQRVRAGRPLLAGDVVK
jgi:DNA polymerase III subunit epsilon